MIRVTGFVAGLLGFAGAHIVETMMWTAWFDGAYSPWFLNSGRAAAFTVVCVFGASLAAGWFRLPAFTTAGGAVVSMAVVLFLKQDGAGTIFPIALGGGGLLIVGVTLLGVWVGSEVSQLIGRQQ